MVVPESKDLVLWEILVPILGVNGKSIDRNYEEWEDKVCQISIGLTSLVEDYNRVEGKWLSPDGCLVRDRLRIVRVACTQEDMEKIADMTAKHYNQDAVMYYLISDKVFIRGV